MNSLHVSLSTEPDQRAKLLDLQRTFADACNALAPVVQSTRCWNRVALHHLAYRALRERFPALGSQMTCNVLYSVSRASRLVYQHPDSPFNLQRLGTRGLPLLYFLPQSPVYFDRHTLSLRDGIASMYTLDGRMRFNLPLDEQAERRFRQSKLREIVLAGSAEGYGLEFIFADEMSNEPPARASGDFPDYLVVVDEPTPTTPLPLPTVTAPTRPTPQPAR